MQPLQRGRAAFDEAAVVLGEISDGGFVSPNYLAGVDEGTVVTAGLAQLGFRSGRRIRQKGVHQRGLPCSVAAHQSDSFSARDAGGETANHLLITVSLAEVLDFENMFARRALLLEFDVGALYV